jgi:hypothetical protein
MIKGVEKLLNNRKYESVQSSVPAVDQCGIK